MVMIRADTVCNSTSDRDEGYNWGKDDGSDNNNDRTMVINKIKPTKILLDTSKTQHDKNKHNFRFYC
jgi:hypothetical protein